ncbi:MAG: hypothetical protein AB7J32_18885 [Pseudonocardia sp.]
MLAAGGVHVRPAADLGRLLLRGAQDALHAVGEPTDDVRGGLLRGPLAPFRLPAHPTVGCRRTPESPARGRRVLRVLRVLRLRAGDLEVGAQSLDHPLQPRDVLVDLPTVVTAEHDVEPRGAEKAVAAVCRHR